MTADEIRAAIAADPALQALVPEHPGYRRRALCGSHALETHRNRRGHNHGGARPRRCKPGARCALRFAGLPPPQTAACQGRLRLDVVAQAGMLQPLVTGGLLTQAQFDALIARAKEPAPVDEYAVRVAIYHDDGSLRV